LMGHPGSTGWQPVCTSAVLHWCRVRPTVSRVAIPVFLHEWFFQGDIYLASLLLFSQPHPSVFLFRGTAWEPDSARTFDFLTRSEIAQPWRLGYWTGCISAKRLPWAWGLLKHKALRESRVVTVWCHIMVKHTQIRERPKALRWQVLLLLIGSHVYDPKFPRIFLVAGNLRFTHCGSSLVNKWKILLSIFYLQRLYQP
jgi:hypothetical protein